MEETDSEYVYVYLDFSEKLNSSLFDHDFFLRVVNLHKPNPLVQLNDLVFKGHYDECPGTNIFFEEIEDPPLRDNICEMDTPIRLKPVLTQTKIIKLKQMKLPKTVLLSKSNHEQINIKLDQDLFSVLDKLEQGILNIEDLLQKDVQELPGKAYQEGINFIVTDKICTDPVNELDSCLTLMHNKSNVAQLEAKYERLKRLARRPVKRMKVKEFIECDIAVKDAYEYHNLERQILQNNDVFRTACGPILEKSFIGGIDFNKCNLQGIKSTTSIFPHDLSNSDLNKLLTIDNLENLSLASRYLIIKECVTKIEQLIENTTPEELKEVDENGRTVEDICNIFKKLLCALEKTISQTGKNVNTEGFSSETSDRKDFDTETYIKFNNKIIHNINLGFEDIFQNVDKEMTSASVQETWENIDVGQSESFGDS